MQRTRDWRRSQKRKRKVYHLTNRHAERIDGYQEVDYNRIKFKHETLQAIQLALDKWARKCYISI